MDDYLDSVKTEDEIIERATQVKDILSSGDFHLAKWMSNSTTVSAKIAFRLNVVLRTFRTLIRRIMCQIEHVVR